MDIRDFTVEITEDAKKLAKNWLLADEDIRAAVMFGWESGKMYFLVNNAGKTVYLTRQPGENTIVYARFLVDEEEKTVTVNQTYAHRLRLCSDNPAMQSGSTREGDGAGWICHACNCEVISVRDIGLYFEDYEFPAIDGMRCPNCGLEMVPSNIVLDQMMMAESMMQAK